MIDMNSSEIVKELTGKLEMVKVLHFLEECKKQGFSLDEAIVELRLMIITRL